MKRYFLSLKQQFVKNTFFSYTLLSILFLLKWINLQELFIDSVAKESYAITAKGKRKTVTKKDFQTVLDTLDCLCFLEGAVDV